MIHYGKNPDGELELHATGEDVAAIYRVIQSAGLQERRLLRGVRKLIEEEFGEDISVP